ncbi:unnamed protein product [Microthlaspi erraticum]|uniref:Uncharacterized protein n=1 Tax=Microthlaspi erraticum TaxID=1685480 RepID=A0A6D2HMK0_9BRAS|nr:unnamed protein product [Microthlaspi erraticum]
MLTSMNKKEQKPVIEITEEDVKAIHARDVKKTLKVIKGSHQAKKEAAYSNEKGAGTGYSVNRRRRGQEDSRMEVVTQITREEVGKEFHPRDVTEM